MADKNILEIMERLMNEELETNSFVTKLDSINAHAYKINYWDKYKQRFGDSEPDDSDAENFKVYWKIDFELENDGLYGITSHIQDIEGDITLMFYDDEEATEPRTETIRIEKGDIEGMKIANEPKMNKNNQLIINGIWIDFQRNEISIEYL